jgi:hypothetical protein
LLVTAQLWRSRLALVGRTIVRSARLAHVVSSKMRLDAAVARRQAAKWIVTAAVLSQPLIPFSAHAEYGQGANVAPPALVPSPFRPTGPMAATCEVVALGREDVCLEYKKVLTAYDQMQLTKAVDAVSEPRSGLDEGVRQLLVDTAKLLDQIEKNAFDEMGTAVKALDVSLLEKLAGSDSELTKRAKAAKSDVTAVVAAVKKLEPSPIARATIKLANDVTAFADGL